MSTISRPVTQQVMSAERDAIRESLVRARPELARRIHDGPSGALLIPVAGGRSIEIGRLPRRGAARWVVVTPWADGARVHEPRSLADYRRIVDRALEAVSPRVRGGPRRAAACGRTT